MAVDWTPDALDRLERAVAEGSRLQLFRRGTEYVVVPERLASEGGRDVLYARHGGDRLAFRLVDLDAFVVLA
jgi:hypothetical protein